MNLGDMNPGVYVLTEEHTVVHSVMITSRGHVFLLRENRDGDIVKQRMPGTMRTDSTGVTRLVRELPLDEWGLGEVG